MGNICGFAAIALLTLFSMRRLISSRIARGHSRSCLRKAYNKTFAQCRSDLLFKNNPSNDPNFELTRIIMRYSRQHKAIRKIVQKHWTILTDYPQVNRFITDCPSITYKRSRCRLLLGRFPCCFTAMGRDLGALSSLYVPLDCVFSLSSLVG